MCSDAPLLVGWTLRGQLTSVDDLEPLREDAHPPLIKFERACDPCCNSGEAMQTMSRRRRMEKGLLKGPDHVAMVRAHRACSKRVGNYTTDSVAWLQSRQGVGRRG